MATMTEITCACGCGRKKMVRTSDVKRGWGKFYNKSCKARHQERRTKQYSKTKDYDYIDIEDDFHTFDSYSLGQD